MLALHELEYPGIPVDRRTGTTRPWEQYAMIDWYCQDMMRNATCIDISAPYMTMRRSC
jgi:hypothetical protein